MNISIRKICLSSASAATIMVAGPAFGYQAAEDANASAETVGAGDIVVTAQRREESLQNVPIAVSAFGTETLKAQKIEGGLDIQTGVPNMTFAQGQRGDNVTIRGIGTKAFSGSSDSATGVHFAGAPVTDNRLFQMDLYDVQRLEVLRGPQGTLYGRNATGGVINVIPARPTDDFEASLNAEFTNHGGRKFRGMVNIPLAQDVLSLRLATSMFDRNGYVRNLMNGDTIDGRSMYSFRATLGFTPTDRLSGYFTWQRFREDDDRLTTGKGVCAADPGPASLGGVDITNPIVRGLLSQGCANEVLTPGKATALPNSLATFFGLAAYRAGLASGDVFAGQTQIPGFDQVATPVTPAYVAQQDIYQGGLTWDATDSIRVEYLGSYQTGRTASRQDALLVYPEIAFNSTALYPGGIVNDPQLGAYDRLMYLNSNDRTSKQHFHELRVASSFSGPFNFSIGGNYLDYRLVQAAGNYSHTLTAFANVANGGASCAIGDNSCIYIDPDSSLMGQGHNYFLSYQPYRLHSYAGFGELYFELSDTVKLTAGARYTKDDKRLDNIPARLLTPGSGYPAGVPAALKASFEAFTGRIGIDWKPELSWTDSTLVYAFASRGYKGGGLNPVTPDVGATFAPEYVNALEIGTKNTLLNGALSLNASAFYYDYKDYQISKFVNRVNVTENVDARVMGLELEAVARPLDGLRFNFTGGLLDSKIKNGTSLDLFDRTQGDADLAIVKNGSASVCVVPKAALADFVAIVQRSNGAPEVAGISGNPNSMFNICGGTYASMGLVPTQGAPANLAGNKLPNAPDWTVSFGAEYRWNLSDSWSTTLRGDYYRQGSSFARPYNAAVDYLPAWENLNLSLKFTQEEMMLDVEFYVKNVTNNRATTDYLYNEDSIGLTARAFLREPRIYAISISKAF